MDHLYGKFVRELQARSEDGWKLHSNKDGLEVFIKQVHQNYIVEELDLQMPL